MATYDYSCPKCSRVEEHVHGMSESPIIKCPACKKVMIRKISLNMNGFIFKGGTPTTHWKEKRLRMKKSEELSVKQQKYGIGPRIKPNIAGVETGSWSDAQKMAKEAGMNHESFTPWVEKEKKQKKIIV